MNATSLFHHKEIQTFLEDIDFYESNNRKGMGITISPNGDLLFKVYLEILESDLIDRYSKILNLEFNNFKKFKKYANFSLPSSYAIGKKISSNNEIFNYYHVKFKHRFSFNNTFYKLKLLDLKKCGTGYSKEYNSNICYRKKYYYVYDLQNKQTLNSIFNLNTDLTNIDHFEIYSKSKQNYKINFIYNDYKDNFNCSVVNELNNLFKKTPVYSGITNNNEKSIYYSFTK